TRIGPGRPPDGVVAGCRIVSPGVVLRPGNPCTARGFTTPGAMLRRGATSGGYWFEPSTAHQKALHKGLFVALASNAWQGQALPRCSVEHCERGRSGREAGAGLVSVRGRVGEPQASCLEFSCRFVFV